MNRGAEVPYWPVNNTENTQGITLVVFPKKKLNNVDINAEPGNSNQP
jgi:hypothetical protein